MTQFKPLGDRVLVKPIKKEESKTKSGIIISESMTQNQKVNGEVVEIGTGIFSQSGEKIPMTVKVGDKVNKGQLIAMDLYESKLKQLKIRAKRNGAFNIEPRVIESTKTIKKLHEKADRVLIDAPCSGLGVLKRNPDSKWKLQPEFIENIKKIQAEVLENYSKIVKPGGKLVYATCSVLPSENQEQIKHFLSTEIGKEFTFVEDKKVLAHESGFDGFYMALLERKN